MRDSLAVSVGMRPRKRRTISKANAFQCYREIVHKQASVFTPSMFMAQLPQIPSLQDLRKVKVGSISFLILIRASNIIGPVLFKSIL